MDWLESDPYADQVNEVNVAGTADHKLAYNAATGIWGHHRPSQNIVTGITTMIKGPGVYCNCNSLPPESGPECSHQCFWHGSSGTSLCYHISFQFSQYQNLKLLEQ
jgi:hypothetical protein